MSFGTENFKEAIKNNNIEHISWVKTNEQLADSLTNSGGGGGGAGGGVGGVGGGGGGGGGGRHQSH